MENQVIEALLEPIHKKLASDIKEQLSKAAFFDPANSKVYPLNASVEKIVPIPVNGKYYPLVKLTPFEEPIPSEMLHVLTSAIKGLCNLVPVIVKPSEDKKYILQVAGVWNLPEKDFETVENMMGDALRKLFNNYN